MYNPSDCPKLFAKMGAKMLRDAILNKEFKGETLKAAELWLAYKDKRTEAFWRVAGVTLATVVPIVIAFGSYLLK